MPRILLEDTYVFRPDPAKLSEALSLIRESRKTFALIPIPGRFSVCDEINGNGRSYPRTVWEKNISNPKSPLQERIANRAAFGLLEHPKDGVVDLRSPISHLVTKVWLKENEVFGEITIVNTAEGLKLAALIEAGYTPHVSSRGYGSVVKNAQGVDVVQEDFVCESWDVVATPSFTTAALTVPREEARPASPATVTEAATVAKPAITTNLAETPSVTVSNQVTIPTTMDKLKSIQESVQSLRAVDPSKLEPNRFAEGLSRIQQLHRDAAAVGSEDSKLSWDVSRLHDELNAVEKSWIESMRAPIGEVAKLQEQQTRTLRVVKAIAETGLTLKKQLGETKILAESVKKKCEEAIKRGKGWMGRAEKAEESLATLERKFDVACTALDLLTERYHTDTTALGRRVLTLEFKPTDEALIKRIKEAKTAKELAAIREEIKPKETKPAVTETAPAAAAAPAPAAAPAAAAAPVTPAPAAAATEPAKEAPKATTTESVTEAIVVEPTTLNRPFTIAESLKVRGSLATA